MIAHVGAFAAAAVHPTQVTPAAPTLDATHKFLMDIGAPKLGAEQNFNHS